MHHGAQKDEAFWGVQTQPAMGDALPTVFKWRQVWCFFLSIYCSTYIISLQLSRTNYANFPAQITLLLLHVGNRMCYNINVAFFVPFRDIEKGKVFCRAILIIIRLENESPWWYPRNRKPLIFLGFPRSSDVSSPLYLSCLSLRFPAGFWRRFQAKSYMESCPSGRRCSTRNAVKSNLPRVRIPNSPPAKPYRSRSVRLFPLSLER